ncbi:hypothetical protein V6N11_071270 [Hibiscus sabdariffa]|uniref:RNase H type-1 domain-containing protein n=1 Tax=Hibiscus sabdariffa TaxID=183260 RepID=A0ABR2TZU8_9ROSI
MVTNDGNWNWNVINNLLPHQVLRRVSAVIPPNPTFGSDTPSWRWEENRLFSSSSAYNALEPRLEEENGKIWKLIWSQHLPQRIREDEDVEHILRRCPKARLTWASMLSPTNLHGFAPLNLQDWIAANLGSSSSFTFEEDWPSYFAVTCWQLCKRRCSLLFNEDYVEVNFVDHFLIGLRHVWRLGFRKIEVETNNVEVARILDRTSNVFSKNAMALSIGALLTLDWDIVTRHIHRTANGVADRLAKLSRGLTGEEFQFTEPPAEVAAAMLEDLNSSD